MREEAAANGLTVVDSSEIWTPRVCAAIPRPFPPPSTSASTWSSREARADLGLYGIAPNLSVVAVRLADEKRRACDAAVDLAPLAELHAAREAAPDARAAAQAIKGPGGREAVAAAQAELVCAGLLKKAAAGGTMSPFTEAALEAFRGCAT